MSQEWKTDLLKDISFANSSKTGEEQKLIEVCQVPISLYYTKIEMSTLSNIETSAFKKRKNAKVIATAIYGRCAFYR